MDREREVAVLFADVSGSTKLYETEGDKVALEAIARCIEVLRQATGSGGGRVVKTIGDEVMAVFPSPDAAATAAANMQGGIEALPPVGTTKLAVRIGFHCGPVLQRENDIFGDTVNMAARLVEQSGKGQIITSSETADRLGALFRSFKRPLYAIHVKGKAEEVVLCEIIWRHSDDMTMSVSSRSPAKPDALALRLQYRGREILLRRNSDSISLGRDAGCSLVVSNDRASRKHCIVERRQDKFVVVDQSTNGTYVTIDGNTEILLQRDEIRLGKRGWIVLGQPRDDSQDAVEYSCD